MQVVEAGCRGRLLSNLEVAEKKLSLAVARERVDKLRVQWGRYIHPLRR